MKMATGGPTVHRDRPRGLRMALTRGAKPARLRPPAPRRDSSQPPIMMAAMMRPIAMRMGMIRPAREPRSKPPEAGAAA